MNTARFGKRVGTYLVDIIFATLFPLTALVFGLVYIPEIKQISGYFIFLAVLAAQWLCYLIIFTLWLFISNGRSLGSLIFGLRVIHPDISRLSFGDCLARAASEGLVVLAVVNMFYVIAVHTEKTVFDRMVNTVVVDWRNRSI